MFSKSIDFICISIHSSGISQVFITHKKENKKVVIINLKKRNVIFENQKREQNLQIICIIERLGYIERAHLVKLSFLLSFIASKTKQIVFVDQEQNIKRLTRNHQEKQFTSICYIIFMNQLNNQGEFIITISKTNHKIVKFIDKKNEIKALKIFHLPKHNHHHFQVRTQLENVKDYLTKIKEKQSSLSLTDHIDIAQQQEKDYITIRVASKFISDPNLTQYYRNESLGMTRKSKNEKEKMKTIFIHYFEELFQLILKGGGIRNFFYTPNNIFINVPDAYNSFGETRLKLNITSTAGLKFLSGEMLSRQQFIEILPCIPPNIYQLIQSQQYDKLNLLIKIRCFAYLMLVHIIKRIPYFTEDNLPPMIDPNDPKIRQIVEGNPANFQILLKIEKSALKEVKKETNIEVHKFLTKILVKNKIEHWSEVLRIVFLQNYINEPSYSRSISSHIDAESEPHKKRRELTLNMLRVLWQIEPNKEFYIRLGLSINEKEEETYVYLLLKLNSNFHLLLKYENIVEYFESQRFSYDTNNIVYKFIKFFNQDYFRKRQSPEEEKVEEQGTPNNSPQSSHYEIKQQIQNDHRNVKQWNKTLKIDKKNRYNPFYYHNIGCHLKNPLSFLEKVLTFQNTIANGNTVQYPDQDKEQVKPTKKENNQIITSPSRRMQSLINFESQLWLM